MTRRQNLFDGEHHPIMDVFINQNNVETVENFTSRGSSIDNQGIINHCANPAKHGKISQEKKLDAFGTKCSARSWAFTRVIM